MLTPIAESLWLDREFPGRVIRVVQVRAAPTPSVLYRPTNLGEAESNVTVNCGVAAFGTRFIPMPEVHVGIEVCERVMDPGKFHAQIKGEPGFWAAGNSRWEAVGGLIQNHPARFGISGITHLGVLPR